MSKTAAKIMLVALGLIIFLACYMFVYMDFSAKTDAVTKEVGELQTKVSTLSAYSAAMKKNSGAIETMRTDMNTALTRYYTSEKPEDFILLANDMETKLGLSVDTISFTTPKPFYLLSGVKDGKTPKDPVTPLQLTCYNVSSTMGAKMKYSQMKQALDFIKEQKDVTRLQSLVLNYEATTGDITGTFVIDKFYITGRDLPDHNPSIPYNTLGKSTLMGG